MENYKMKKKYNMISSRNRALANDIGFYFSFAQFKFKKKTSFLFMKHVCGSMLQPIQFISQKIKFFFVQ